MKGVYIEITYKSFENYLSNTGDINWDIVHIINHFCLFCDKLIGFVTY